MRQENMFNKNLSYHFSVDDVIDSFIEVSDKNISPYKHPFFNFLLKIHTTFNVNIDLYLFYQKNVNGKLRTLEEVSSKNFKNWFKENPWLRLGPHALDYDTAPYDQSISEQKKTFNKIYSEIERFASKTSLSTFLRLHFFSESFELGKYFKNKKIFTLFTTDKDAVSYRLPAKLIMELKSAGYTRFKGIEFVRSQFRVENLIDQNLIRKGFEKYIDNLKHQFGFIVFFTHEREIPKLKIRNTITSTLEILTKMKLESN